MKSFESTHVQPGTLKKICISDACIVIALLCILCVQVTFLLTKLNTAFLHESITHHGEINEGIAEVPIYKNPLYANNTPEKDIVMLTHAGLLKHNNKGDLIPHLTKTWEQKHPNQYVFILHKNITFHDGTPLTTKDVIHTINMIKNEEKYHSAYHKAWAETETHAVDERTLSVTVPPKNQHFPEAFTMPVLPEHVWKKIPQDRQKNYKGSGVHIGAGPYKYEREALTLDERPISITLTEFPEYVLGRPFIKKINLNFFTNPKNLLKAYEDGDIDGVHGITPTDLEPLLKQRKGEKDTVYTATTDRVFGAFFNAEDGRILQDPFIRSTLARSVDRSRIITEVFQGYASPTQSPLATDKIMSNEDITLEEIESALNDVGWEFEATTGKRWRDGIPLEVTFIIPDIEEATQIAEILEKGWRRLGISIKTSALPEKEMQKAIKKREFDIVLHGYKARSAKDLVKLWKSGNEDNLASLTSFGNPTLNTLLTELEQTTPPPRLSNQEVEGKNDTWKNMVYDEIKVEMIKHVPAIFLYSPHFLYILPENITRDRSQKTQTDKISNPSDRFTNIHKWHLKKEKVWKMFVKN